MQLSDDTRAMARRFAALHAANWLKFKTPKGRALCREQFRFWYRAWKTGVSQ